MTITREALDQAAFWEQAVCLECGRRAEGDDYRRLRSCLGCGGDAVYWATLLQAVIEFVVEEGGGDGD